MAGEDARLKAGLKAAEDELNLIKNQVQQTLLDIREHVLDVTNPFNNMDPSMVDEDEISISGAGAAGAAGADAVSKGAEGVEESTESEQVEETSVAEDEVLLDEEELLDDGDLEEEYEEFETDDVVGGGYSDGGGGGYASAPVREELIEEEEEFPAEDFELDSEPEQLEESELPEGAEAEEEDASEEAERVISGDGDGTYAGGFPGVMGELDLVTLASLVRWVAVSQQRLGANRVEVLLDTYEQAGRISPQVRAILKTLSALSDEDPDGPIPVRDIVTAMVRMEGVLTAGRATDSNKLLGLLLDIDDDPLDRLIA